MNYEVFDIAGKNGSSDCRNQIKLYISKEHRFGTDSLLLSDFVGIVKNKTVVDLCSGCGIIPIMLCRGNPPSKIYAVEIQQEASNLIKHTVLENKLDFIKVIHGDLRDSNTLTQIVRGSVDVVSVNPPYFPEKSGFERISNSQKTARYEGECTLIDVIRAASELLKFGGELKMCMVASRFAECVGIMQKYSIEPKEVVFIPKKRREQTTGNPQARLFLISGKKGGKSGVTVEWQPPETSRRQIDG